VKNLLSKEELKKTSLFKFYRFLKNKNPFRVEYNYGYICNSKQIEKLHKDLITKYPISNNSKIDKSLELPKRYIFIGDKNISSTMRIAVFGDIISRLKNDSKYSFFVSRELINKKYTKLHKIFFKINKIFPLPFKSFWEKRYTTSTIKLDNKTDNYVILLAGAYFVESWSQTFLWKRLYSYRQKHQCKIFLYLVDPVEKFPKVKYWFKFFDKICTYSSGDAQAFGFNYIPLPCVNLLQSEELKSSLLKSKDNYDIYLRAEDNGRGKIIKEVYEYLHSNNVNCNIIVNSNEKEIQSPGYKITNERIPYYQMVAEELNANVILEIVLPNNGSSGTLRKREAVIYGKKLLTNDPYYNSDRFYKTGNIRYFNTVNDIDIEWIKEREPVNYNYNDDYSVENFCKALNQIM